MPKPPTLADVAAACGVSVSTASRALSGVGELSPRTRDRVIATARRLGYDRRQQRRGRPSRRADDLIELVLTHFDDPWSSEVIAGARSAATERGYDLVLTAERDAPDDDWPRRLQARRPAGAVLGLLLPTATQLRTLEGTGIPLVLLDPRSDQHHPLTSVRTTDHAGGADAARHLRDRGARRFIVVEGAPSYRFGRARVAGFLAELGPDAAVVSVRAGWDAESAASAVLPALQRARLDGGPVGVFACSDDMAVGVYRAAAATGDTIGTSVLLVGFDDTPAAAWLTPALTTVHQPIRAMAAAAVLTLADIVAGARPAGGRIDMPTRLVVRGSSGAGSV
jgi:LacI family transcriptional regulator